MFGSVHGTTYRGKVYASLSFRSIFFSSPWRTKGPEFRSLISPSKPWRPKTTIDVVLEHFLFHNRIAKNRWFKIVMDRLLSNRLVKDGY
jgi:hypothetical protein